MFILRAREQSSTITRISRQSRRARDISPQKASRKSVHPRCRGWRHPARFPSRRRPSRARACGSSRARVRTQHHPPRPLSTRPSPARACDPNRAHPFHSSSSSLPSSSSWRHPRASRCSTPANHANRITRITRARAHTYLVVVIIAPIAIVVRRLHRRRRRLLRRRPLHGWARVTPRRRRRRAWGWLGMYVPCIHVGTYVIAADDDRSYACTTPTIIIEWVCDQSSPAHFQPWTSFPNGWGDGAVHRRVLTRTRWRGR